MKNLVDFLKEGYEGQYYNGLAIGPFATKETINFDKKLSDDWTKNKIEDFVETYFDTLDYDKINSLDGQQRFIYYLKDVVGYKRRWLNPNEVSFRKKDILNIKNYVKSKTGKELDKWEDKLKNEEYDYSDEPKDPIGFFDHYIDTHLRKSNAKYKQYISKVIKFNPNNYSGGDDGPYFYRRYFRDDNNFDKNMTIYTYVLWCEDSGFYIMFVTDDKFNILRDWSDEISVEQLAFNDLKNIEIATEEETNKFWNVFDDKRVLSAYVKEHPLSSYMNIHYKFAKALSILCPIDVNFENKY